MKANRPYGYITTLKSGKHYVIFDYKDASGKRKRKWFGTGLPEKCTKKALNLALQKIIEYFEKSISDGTIAILANCQACPTTELRAFFSEWLAYIKPNTDRTTHRAYSGIVRRFIEFMKDNYPAATLDTLDHTHVQSYLNHKLEARCMGSTVKQYYLALHTAFAYGVKMELLPKHPMEKMNIPRADRHEATF